VLAQGRFDWKQQVHVCCGGSFNCINITNTNVSTASMLLLQPAVNTLTRAS
jgi:hypothetical protein